MNVQPWIIRLQNLGFARSGLLSRVGMNSAWLLLARLIVQVQTMLLTILVARRLGVTSFGQYILITSLIFLGNVFTTFGTDTLLIRRVAQSRKTDIPDVQAALGLQIALTILYIVAIWLWTAIDTVLASEVLIALRLYSLSLIPLAFSSVFSAILRGLERMDLALYASLATAGLQLVSVWLVLSVRSDLVPLMVVLVFVQIFVMGFSYLLCRVASPLFHFNLNIKAGQLSFILHSAWPLAVLSILGVVYQRIGVFGLSLLGNDAQTGIYSAAMRVVEGLKLGHVAVFGALLPALAHLRKQSDPYHEAETLFRKTSLVLLGLGLIGAICMSIFAGQLIHFFYGDRYSAAIPALRVLAWLLVPYSYSSAYSVDLVSQSREKLVTLSIFASIFTAGILNFWLIPLWGVTGACFTAIVAEIVLVVGLWRMRRLAKNGRSSRK